MVLLLDVGAGKVDCAAATAMSPPLGDRAAAALLILLRLKTWDRRGRPASVEGMASKGARGCGFN
jgi:hypothetical protein